MKRPRVFVDSDVIISSLLSSKGAAYALLHEKGIEYFISNISQEELRVVSKRLGIGSRSLQKLINKRCTIVKLGENIKAIKKDFEIYTTDINDAHIVAGTKKAKARFLTTYNMRHFKIHKINQDLNIIVTKPANLLQYIRSLS